jgi:hypothetical protein
MGIFLRVALALVELGRLLIRLFLTDHVACVGRARTPRPTVSVSSSSGACA